MRSRPTRRRSASRRRPRRPETLETILNEDVPVGLPFFYNYLSGHANTFQGVRVSALGQMFVDKASQV